MNANDSTLGFVEVAFFSITALISDALAKAADVRLLGIETTGNENLLIRIQGDTAAVQAALSAAKTRAGELGARVLVHSIPRPGPGLAPLLNAPNSLSPLYGGKDQFLPKDSHAPDYQPMNENQQALGILETQGLTAVLEATDVMLKSANVTLLGKEKIGAAYVTVMIQGDVAAVKAAVNAGAAAVEGLGRLVAAHVIPRPHNDLLALLPERIQRS